MPATARAAPMTYRYKRRLYVSKKQVTRQLVPHDDPRDPSVIARRMALFDQRLRRRSLLGSSLGFAGLMALGGRDLRFGPDLVAAAQDATLPDDAAPPEQQVYVLPDRPNLDKTPDFYESVYERTSDSSSDIFSEPLIRLNRNFEIVPAGALEWSSNEEGTVWTFKLDPVLMWNDGNSVTAADWIATFRYGADPAHAWDFTWYFQGVMKGWDEAIAGEIPLEELGVRQGADEHELIIETQIPAPYLPAMLIFSCPLSAAALEEHGPLYNSRPETSVSSGPMRLVEWLVDQRVVFEKNPDYTGKMVVPVNRVVIKFADAATWFVMYQNNEIDFMRYPAPADLLIAQAEFPEQIYSSVGDFRTFYLFFDVSKPPFDQIEVRQAFSHAIDRDAIEQQILGPAGTPAYSWLAPGFPAANGEALSGIQNFDPARAKELFSAAGFADPSTFPAQVLQVRDPKPIESQVAQAVAAMLRENLGIAVEVQDVDQDSFMDALTAKPTELPFGFVSYGMDFVDPYNMLSVWLSGGRHSWVNEEFDQLVRDAAAFIGDPAERTRMFQDAERILVEDVPAVFLYHDTPVQLIKPWVKGAALEPDANGITSIHWPGYTTMCTVPAELYIGADAPPGRGDL
ncbi:MAG: putative oligopeptide transporter substrate binding protein [Thermomicrobiales bacterium]|nr:putative oligopeptide transporter substrate binding protein [Thermomicrobiales bacterium]